jgi:hypothetical protein
LNNVSLLKNNLFKKVFMGGVFSCNLLRVTPPTKIIKKWRTLIYHCEKKSFE